MTAQISRYMKMDPDARDLIRARAKQRYRESPEEHRMKRYLHAVNKGVIRCPKESNLKRHCVVRSQPVGRQRGCEKNPSLARRKETLR